MLEVVGLCPKVSDQLLSKCNAKFNLTAFIYTLVNLIFFIRNATKNIQNEMEGISTVGYLAFLYIYPLKN